MAEWIKLPDSSYARLSALQRVFVQQQADMTWAIVADFDPGIPPSFVLRGGFATQAAAQTALDGAIANNGGSL